MNIWVLVLGEPLETDQNNNRLHRAGMLARKLVDSGHNITLWSSNVDHIKKELRSKKTEVLKISENYKLILLAGRLYKKNISFARIGHNIDVTKEFNKHADTQDKPDIVISNYPIIELTDAALIYCKNNKIPSIVDIRDFWPDIFYETLPKSISFIGNILFWSLNRKSKNIVKNATGITGITSQAIKWARSKNNQDLQETDKAFPLAYENVKDYKFNKDFLFKNNLDPIRDNIYCFFGNLSNRLELDNVAKAAKIIHSKNSVNIKLVICGSGEMYKPLMDTAKRCPVLVLPGWIEKDEINTLLEVSKAGLLPYPSSLDFIRSYPNKVGEYLSKNLPIISSVQGAMDDLISKFNIGITYQNNSPQSLANTIQQIEDDENNRKVMSKNAGECFKKMFDADNVYNDYTSYIEKISKQNL